MDFSLSDEQRMIRDVAERFVREDYDLDTRRKLIASPEGEGADNWSRLAEFGWTALMVPEEAGGFGGSCTDLTILMMELGAGVIIEPFVETAVLGTTIVERSPRAEGLLPRICEGTLRLALAHAEAGDRFEIGATRATRAAREGDGFVLSGEKVMVFAGPCADELIVSAMLEGDSSYSLLLVDRRAAGVEVSSYPLIDGTRAADIRLSQVHLSSDALLVPASDAQAVLALALDRATLACLAEAVGSMDTCLDLCSEYIKTRQQFGQPIGKFQALQHIMSEMFVEAQEARSILYQALSRFEDEPEDRSRAISAAKIVIGEASQIVSRSGIQLHGGYGITDEFAISHHYRRLLVLEKKFGDIACHNARLGKAMAA